MSSLVNLEDVVVELAETLSERLGTDRERIIEVALTLLAIDLGLRLAQPSTEKSRG